MSPLFRLIAYARPYRADVLKASSYSVLNKIFDIMPEVLIGVAVDVVVNREASFIASLGYPDLMTQLGILAVLTFVIWLLESVFEYLYMIKWRNLAQTLQHEMRIHAYSHIQGLEMAYFEDKGSGNLLSILNEDVNQLERFLDGGANDLIQVGTTVIVVGGIFFYISPLIAVFAIAPIPVIVLGAFFFQKHLGMRYASVREKAGSLNARLVNNIGGLATIKSFTTEDFEISQVEKESKAYRDANRRAIKLSSAFIPIIRMAILTGFIATLLIGGWLTLEGALAVGAYSVLVFLTQRLLWPLTRLAQTVDLYERAMASTNRILNLISTPIRITYEGQPLKSADVKGQVEFKNLGFGYEGRNTLFTDFNLLLEAGKTTAFVGATGSGKSTIAKLMLRFYEPNDGEILLDGVDLKSIQLQDLRRAIGLVSQDVFLFPGTVRENIVYGAQQASLEQVIEAAKTAEIHDFIEELPEAYETVIGERGQKLSGGQRQRIAIARTILKNPPILIFDEATSSVDNETEAAIQRSLERIVVGRTTLVIAHRLSTIRNAHKICVLEHGKITESGTHDELIELGGMYSALWRVQTGESLKK